MNKKISFSIAVIIIAILAIVVVGGTIVYQYYLTPKTEKGISILPKTEVKMEFSSTECKQPVSEYEDKIKETHWISGNTLQVKVYTVINCNNKIEKGDYEIKGNKITLKFNNVGDDLANCICGHDLIYKFSDIEKKDYEFEITAEKIYKPELKECITASSFSDYLKKAEIQVWGSNEIWKTIKTKDIPVPVNISNIEIYQIPIGAAGGDIITTTVIKSGNSYCKLTDRNAQILFAPIKKEQAVKYLIFRLNTLAPSGYGASQETILSKYDYSKYECRGFDVNTLKDSEKKITTIEEVNDGFLINWIFYTNVGVGGYYEQKLKISSNGKIQELEQPGEPFINCGQGIIF